jgi:antitoxin CptB
MKREDRLKRLKFRCWHRGTREADMMIGGFFDAYHTQWNDLEIDWVEAFIEEQDVDIMGWALGAQPVPSEWRGALMNNLMKLDFVQLPQ